MYKVKTQNQLNEILKRDSADLEELGIDTYENPNIKLDGPYFEIDCSQELFNSYTDICFIGNGAQQTIVKFINCERDFARDTDIEVDIFEYTMSTAMRDVYLTAKNFLEVRFIDEEGLSKWQNIGIDTSKINIINEEAIHDEFMEKFEGYDVEGVLQPGDHVVVDRDFYTHHGIYIGNNKLFHYSGEPGTSGIITEVSLQRFALRDTFWVYEHHNSLDRNEIINRAKQRLNENDYNLVFNNCEHFCHWCCTGEKWSNQIAAASIFGINGLWVSKIVNDGGAKKYSLS